MRITQLCDVPASLLAQALAELGRIIKTQHLLACSDDEVYRRRILIQLNRGEQRHQLTRVLFHGCRRLRSCTQIKTIQSQCFGCE
jgi:hypothetical protein